MNHSTGQERFPHLFSKGRIGKYETENRIKWAACCVSNFNNRDGSYSEREYARDRVIANMGCGVMTNQGAYPDRTGLGKAYWSQICLNDDKYIPGIAKVADIFHGAGAIAFQQILHAGRYGGIDLGYCLQPSPVPQTLKHFRPPREITKDQIQEAVDDHAQAALRAKKAGFEGAEITSFMGYLLACFLSPFTNRRTDEYGGSVEKRARFMVETIRAVKKVCGEEFLLCIRLNGKELMDEYGGNTDEECVHIMEIAQDAGVDLISMVIGWHESRNGALGRDIPHDHWLSAAEGIKARIKVPIAFGPRLADPVIAERAIAEGLIDFWEICRPGLADPDIVRKTAENRVEEIKPCIGDLTCLARLFANLPYICTVNPVLGHEIEPEYRITPATRKKKVIVAGGGIAGMECAVAAAQKGHSVTIYEKKRALGGQLLSACREVQGGENLLALIRYYETQVRKSNIAVKLQTPFTRTACAAEAPDVVVVATGAAIERPRIPGFDKPVVSFAYDVLEANPRVTGKRLVVLEGGKVGLIVAEHFASQGNDTIIVTLERRVDADVSTTFRWRHAAWVKEFGIRVMTQASAIEITDTQVIVRDESGAVHTLFADMIVVAGPRIADNALYGELEYMTDEIYLVGDSVTPRHMTSAIHEAYRLGVRI